MAPCQVLLHHQHHEGMSPGAPCEQGWAAGGLIQQEDKPARLPTCPEQLQGAEPGQSRQRTGPHPEPMCGGQI